MIIIEPYNQSIQTLENQFELELEKCEGLSLSNVTARVYLFTMHYNLFINQLIL